MRKPFAIAVLLTLPAAATPQPGPGCTFDSGTTTCVEVSVSTVEQTQTLVSGCLFGPEGVPGRRERVFELTVQITATTTTLNHGLEGVIYEVSTAFSSEVVASRQISDVCSPIQEAGRPYLGRTPVPGS